MAKQRTIYHIHKRLDQITIVMKYVGTTWDMRAVAMAYGPGRKHGRGILDASREWAPIDPYTMLFL